MPEIFGAALMGGGSGPAYAVIDVTYPEGSVCTCTNGTRTMQAKDSSGRWLFQIPRAGEWTVKATKGGQSTSQPVNVTQLDVYRVTLTYFAATISVTYPVGSMCAISTDPISYSDIIFSGNTSGFWEFTVPYTGEWWIACWEGDYANPDRYKATTVNISANGQAESVTLRYELVLFDGGDVTSLTGGWQATGSTSGVSSSVGNTISLSAYDDSGYAKVITLTTKNTINFAEYSTLVAAVSSRSGNCVMKVGSSASASINNNGNVSLDISGISSEKIAFEVGAWKNSVASSSLTVTRVWLE